MHVIIYEAFPLPPPPTSPLKRTIYAGAAAAPPDVVSYGGAITACARAGRVEEALRLVAELRSNQARATQAAVRGTPPSRDVTSVRADAVAGESKKKLRNFPSEWGTLQESSELRCIGSFYSLWFSAWDCYSWCCYGHLADTLRCRYECREDLSSPSPIILDTPTSPSLSNAFVWMMTIGRWITVRNCLESKAGIVLWVEKWSRLVIVICVPKIFKLAPRRYLLRFVQHSDHRNTHRKAAGA